MKLKVFTVLFSLFIICQLSIASEQNTSKTLKIGIGVRKFQAWSKYRDGDYKDALKRYKELNTARPDNAFYNYMIGKCFLAMDNYDDAISYFEAAKRLDPKVTKDLSFQVGLAYHKKGDIDNALKNYNNYISYLSPTQLKRDVLIMDYVKSCILAKEMKAEPLNVKITKLNKNVNSDYDDASPGLSADGKSLFFTSRRVADGIEKLNFDIDPFNDKMYVSIWDASINSWGKAQPVEGDINKNGHIGSLSLSHDGKTMFIFKNIPNETFSGDIFFSEQLEEGKWTKPVNIGKPVNSTYFESSASLSPDANVLYFVSERKGTFGNADIYRSHRLAQNKWSTPENLKGVINSEYDELGVFISADGKTLYFSSNGHCNMGGYDIFMSTIEDGVWSQPKNMGYPINSEFDEKHFVLSPDGKTAYISSNRDGVFDIYQIDMTNYNTKEPVKIVTQYVNEPTHTQSTQNETNKTDKKIPETEISIYNDRTNEKIANFTSANTGGDYVLKLKTNETYTINFINKEEQKNIAYIKTNESGEFHLKISNKQEFLVSVEKSWKQALLRIKLIEN